MKVFLGGTCNGSKWRDELISLLKIDYFTPVVDDWKPEDMENEIRERESADFCLYMLTPKMSGCYSLAEVAYDSVNTPRKTILCILYEDNGKKFDDSQMKQILALTKLVSKHSPCFTSLKDVARRLNKCYEKDSNGDYRSKICVEERNWKSR